MLITGVDKDVVRTGYGGGLAPCWGPHEAANLPVPSLPAARPQNHPLRLPGNSICRARAPWSIAMVRQTWGVM